MPFVPGPLVFAEIGRPDSGREDKAVVRIVTILGNDGLFGVVDLSDLIEKNRDVLSIVEDSAEGAGNLDRRKRGSRHLIKEWLEKVVILTINQSDLETVVIGEGLGAVKSCESSSDSDDAML